MTLRNVLAASAAVGALLSSSAMAANYIVFNSKGLPTNLDAQVIRAGGVLEQVFPFGVAIVSGPDSGLKAAISGATTVKDVGFDVEAVRFEELGPDAGFPPSSGDDDTRFDLQWGHNYVGAQQSWDRGFRGQGVRVAVLDTGFDLDHPDLAPNIDFASSADMTGEGLAFTVPGFSHGSHVAGTIGAADNAFGTIGVAPDVDLVLVKVLFDAGSGTFTDIIEGIYYAATQNVQVMNMSLGAVVPRGGADAAAISHLANAVKAAMAYATQQGVTVVTSAGNAAADLDGDGDNVRFQTGLGHNLGVAALGPNGWAKNPNQSLNPSYYTNYGTSMVDFAAPGGDFLAYTGTDNCTVAGLTRPCWVFDGVFSTSSNLNPAIASYAWAQGTSMAAPHTAGVAALIISETGNSDPEFVFAEMRKRAIDGGKVGRDDFYGHGAANTGN
jgi:subtilisin family serine protease